MVLFETLMLKTFFILTLSLFSAYLGCMFSASILGPAYREGNFTRVKTLYITALIANIIAFIALMFLSHKTPLNMVLMFVFTFSSGFTLGIYAISRGDVMRKAVALTALITLVAGLVASMPGMDFAWMGKFLFIGLIVILIYSVIRLFFSIKSGQRFMAAFGVILFTGYLLYDFNRLAKLKGVAAANNWETALNFAISIYLDIINLLIQLMQLMGGSSN